MSQSRADRCSPHRHTPTVRYERFDNTAACRRTSVMRIGASILLFHIHLQATPHCRRLGVASAVAFLSPSNSNTRPLLKSFRAHAIFLHTRSRRLFAAELFYSQQQARPGRRRCARIDMRAQQAAGRQRRRTVFISTTRFHITGIISLFTFSAIRMGYHDMRSLLAHAQCQLSISKYRAFYTLLPPLTMHASFRLATTATPATHITSSFRTAPAMPRFSHEFIQYCGRT